MTKHDLYMKRPASVFGENWRDGTPLGNGLTGINLYGGVSRETLILSRYDMWSTVGVGISDAPKVSNCIDDMRNLATKGEYAKASTILYEQLKKMGYKDAGQHMRCLCQIVFYFGCMGVYSDYTRCLHMDSGEAEITYNIDEYRYRRRTFVSRDSDIIVSECEFGQPTSFTANASFYESHEDGREDHIKDVHIANEEWKEQDGFYVYTSMNDDQTFCGMVMTIVPDGKCMVTDSGITVENAKRATTYIKTFSSEKDRELAILNAIELVKKEANGYNDMFILHKRLHKELYLSTNINIYDENDLHSNEELLDIARNKECPPELIEKMWRFGRYLFVSGTNEKGHPFPLYGLWVSGYDRPWSQHVANENVEMIYWHTMVGGLVELVKPLIHWYFERMNAFRECAKNIYGCNGIFVPAYTTREQTSPVTSVPVVMHFMGCAGWLARHFYEYYLATCDEALFEGEILPFMLETAAFYEDYLYEDENGMFEFYPSVSPENTPLEYENINLGLGHPMPVYKNATIEFAILKELLTNLIDVAKTNPRIVYKTEKWKDMLSKIPDYIINEDGAIAEWIDDAVHDNYFHRHLSHIYPVFPGTEIEDCERYELMQNFEKAVDLRKLGSYTGWSLAHMSSIYARFGKSDKAFNMINMITKVCLLENFFTLHNDFRYMGITTDKMGDERFAPVQLDAIMGTVNAVQEWLIRVTKKKIYILPACPKQLKSGSAENLCFFGGKLNLKWNLSKKICTVDITATRDILYDIVFPFGRKVETITLLKGDNITIEN